MSEEWREVRLGDITRQVRRERRVAEGSRYRLLGVRWYGKGPFHRETGVGGKIKASRLYEVHAGDLIYNRLFAWKGSFGMIGVEFDNCFVSGEFPAFQVDKSQALVEFVNLVMCRPSVWTVIEQQSTGSTATSRNRWKEERFAEWEIALPPLDGQRRIVDLIGAVDEAIEAASSSQEQCSSFIEAWQSEAESRIRAGKCVELGAISDIRGGVAKDTKRQLDPSYASVPYLRVANVQRGFLDLDEIAEIRVPPAQAEDLRLEVGDILLNEGGDRDKLGRGWVWEEQIPYCIHQNHVFRARIRNDLFDPYYVASLTNGRFAQRWFEENGIQTTNLASININSLRRFPIPLLPVEEQRELVALALSVRAYGEQLGAERSALASVRTALLADLLSGDHQIPTSYDEILSA